MQYHFDGFRPGDPSLLATSHAAAAPQSDVDVAIVGCGPAGLTLAAQLSSFSDIRTRIFERKAGPLEVGQADGIACRSMEMFEAFGFAEKAAKEAYWVNETAFWRPDEHNQLHRADRIKDVEDDLSEMPHVILSQARVHDFYLELMGNGPHRLQPDYGLEFAGLRRSSDPDYPLGLTFTGTDRGASHTIRTRYLVGCDGARSAVRQALGYTLDGQSARQLWGVMDVLAVTDFPDIRLKCAIQSANAGSLLIIPREGGAMVRTYVELDALQGDERAAERGVNADMLIEKITSIIAPYRFDVKEVAWCSAYEIGQRVCQSFDDLGPDRDNANIPRVFIAGDACHTHSPKAGQGMNVSMADAFNLGWKLAAVLRGQAQPELLRTYSDERQAKAQELIDFDRDMARLFGSQKRSDADAARFQRYFQKHGRYTAGVETRYDPSIVIGGSEHQELARGFTVGMRFHSAPVIRLADAKPMQLGHALKADGRWRLILFAPRGDVGQAGQAITALCDYLQGERHSPVLRFSRRGQDTDAVIDVRAVFQSHHRDMRLEAIPPLLKPSKGRFGLTDYEKIFCPDLVQGADIFDLRGIDRDRGALVIIRPDQFVASVQPLEDHAAIAAFFDRFMATPDAAQSGLPDADDVAGR